MFFLCYTCFVSRGKSRSVDHTGLPAPFDLDILRRGSPTLSNAGEYNSLQLWWVQLSPTLVSTTVSKAGEYNSLQSWWVQPSPKLVSTTLSNAGEYNSLQS